MSITVPDRPEVPALNAGIRRAVLASGLTASEAGYRLGVGASTVGKWIHGLTTPSDRNVKRFCLRFGVSEEDLRAGLPDLYTTD